ncbi:MAG TPA: GAF domain-containing protein [Anaeromyxobacteraceae bacterium]|nr:GAF domain-containing protein [Anaeromyxobacteraceae bacterium]
MARGTRKRQVVEASDRVAPREQLMELAQLGARIQRERSDEDILARAADGLLHLGLCTVLARPAGESLRVDRVALPGTALQTLEAALGGSPVGLEFRWPATTEVAWRDGVAFTDDAPAAASSVLGPESRLPGALLDLGLTRAVTVRVDVSDRPHAVLGVLGSWLRREDLPAFRLFGAQLSAALDTAQAIRDLSRRNEELAALNRLAATAAAAPDLPAFFARGAEELMRSLECDGVVIWLLDEARRELEMAFEIGATDEVRSAFRRLPVDGTTTGRVMKEGVPRLIQQQEYPPEVRTRIAGLGFASHGAVPLRVRAKVVGVLNVAWRKPRDERSARLDLLQAMGGPFAAAVEAHRLLADLRGRVSELTLLNDLALAAANLNPIYLLETALKRVLSTLDSDAGNAYLAEGGEMVRVASAGLSAGTLQLLGPPPFTASGGEAAEAALRLEPVLIANVAASSERGRLLHEREGLEVGLAVPIAMKGRALGALVIGRRRPEPYRPEEVQLLSTVAAQVSVALDHARLFADTQRQVADLGALNQLSLSVFGSGPADAAKLLETAAGEIGRALTARSVAVLLLGTGARALRSAAGWGAPLPSEPVEIPVASSSLAGQTLVTQAPVWSADTSTDPRSAMRGHAAAPPMSMLLVPLTSRRAPRGVVAIAAELGRRFGEAEVALAFALATTAANALENAELHAETRRRAEELGLLLEVGRSLVATLELKQVLDAGVANLARMVGAPDAYLFLVDQSGRELEIRAAAGSFPELVGSRVPVDPPRDSLGAMVFHRREPLVLEDGTGHPALHPESLGLGRGSAYLGLPLVVRDRTIGSALIVDPRGPRRFSPAEVERAAAIANQLAVAVENARLYGDLRRSYAELARAQAQLVQRERLAALGELSAVVAHEVRNPLGVIFNSLGSLRRLLRPEGDARMLLDIVGEEADRLNRIVGDLLDFARPSTPAPRPEALDRLLEDAVAAAVAENRDIAVERDVEPDLPLVSMDARLMRQAVLNVAVNAVQAMPRGGRLTVRARREGSWARVEIRDSGPGIPDEIRHRVFEPFFTTKASGTGLGLAVVRRIVEGHGGEVAVAGEPGQGTAVTIRIPLEAPGQPGLSQG